MALPYKDLQLKTQWTLSISPVKQEALATFIFSSFFLDTISHIEKKCGRSANLKNAAKIIIVTLEICRDAGWKFKMLVYEEAKQYC